MNLNEIHPMQKATELRLLAAAIELQHLTGMASNMVPIPGGDRVIAVGAPADVLRLLEVTSAAQPVAASAGIEGLTRYFVEFESREPEAAYLAADVERLLATQSAKQGAQPEQSEPNMLWDAEDGEGAYGDSPQEFAEVYADNCMMAGEESDVEVTCAYRGRNRTMRISVAKDDEVEHRASYSWVDEPTSATPAAPLQTMDDTTRDEALEDELQAVAAFLMGDAPLEGVNFGERHPTKAGAYWWRLNLRAALHVARKG